MNNEIKELSFRYDWVALSGSGSALIGGEYGLEFEFIIDSDGSVCIDYSEALDEDSNIVPIEGAVLRAIEERLTKQL